MDLAKASILGDLINTTFFPIYYIIHHVLT